MREFWMILGVGLPLIAAISHGWDFYDASLNQMQAELSGGKIIVARK